MWVYTNTFKWIIAFILSSSFPWLALIVDIGVWLSNFLPPSGLSFFENLLVLWVWLSSLCKFIWIVLYSRKVGGSLHHFELRSIDDVVEYMWINNYTCYILHLTCMYRACDHQLLMRKLYFGLLPWDSEVATDWPQCLPDLFFFIYVVFSRDVLDSMLYFFTHRNLYLVTSIFLDNCTDFCTCLWVDSTWFNFMTLTLFFFHIHLSQGVQ